MSAPPPFSHKCDVLRFQYGVYGEVEDDKLVAYEHFPCRLAAADSKLLLTVGYVGNAAEYVELGIPDRYYSGSWRFS